MQIRQLKIREIFLTTPESNNKCLSLPLLPCSIFVARNDVDDDDNGKVVEKFRFWDGCFDSSLEFRTVRLKGAAKSINTKRKSLAWELCGSNLSLHLKQQE